MIERTKQPVRDDVTTPTSDHVTPVASDVVNVCSFNTCFPVELHLLIWQLLPWKYNLNIKLYFQGNSSQLSEEHVWKHFHTLKDRVWTFLASLWSSFLSANRRLSVIDYVDASPMFWVSF